ncbi:zinc ABC transporter substrate-binding protein [Roseibium aggregatum]|uniref:High-affinity zinc uptake system protein ZnuA n=1 Tax=Roseibium aggregatum TaxID=187304 RepID=A0A939EDC6_9HYPH|nr:zinc ABC transporter substrate-binding protein [Roseibium aggregatum]MBN9670492.1 zinc ABC transporter substrate-binding protein [Roseibium aggregatum]
MTSRFSVPALAGSLCLVSAGTPALADALTVVTTIKPIHSIAAAVMKGVGEPHILIDGAASPHGFALKPSQATLLQGADVVFWVGPELSLSLEKPIHSMASKAEVIALMDADGIEQLDIREGANFDAHDHGHADEHGHEHDEDAHGDDDGDGHEHEHEDHADEHDDHEEHADHADHEEHDHEEEHASEDHHDHDHGEEKDAHIWLNPQNGIAIAGAMAETLAKIDPENAGTYQANAAAFAKRIQDQEKQIAAELEPVSGKKFVVFHDAYHHFEHHFDFEASGAITVSPETLASADRIAEIQHRIEELDVTCVFQEPQFEAKLVDVALEGSGARKGTLDPLGTQLENGPDLYPQLLENLARSLSDCLSGQS